MGIRVRSTIALLLLLTLLLLNINPATLDSQARDSALAEPFRSHHHADHEFEFIPDKTEEERIFEHHGHETASPETTYRQPAYAYDPPPPPPPPPRVRPQIHPHHANTTTTASTATATATAPLVPPSSDIRLLIGIMSPFVSSSRRHLLRAAYAQFPESLPVDILFVQGTLNNDVDGNPRNYRHQEAMQRTAARWENETQGVAGGDILLLDCEENMVEGKTYEFFKTVGREWGHRGYTHVMKTDDDSFVNIPGTSPIPVFPYPLRCITPSVKYCCSG